MFSHHTTRSLVTGFTLVETLVAISVLLLVVIGPLTITARTAKSSTFATEQTIAHYIAQEGLEFAQKARDDLLLEHFRLASTTPPLTPLANPWGQFSNQSGTFAHCYTATGCGLQTNNTGTVLAPVNCSVSANACRIYYSAATTERSRYRHSPTTNTTIQPYTRTIRFQRIDNGGVVNEVRVISEVTWRTGSLIAPQRVRLETSLFNVYDRP